MLYFREWLLAESDDFSLLVNACARSPGDFTPILVACDWLDEHDEPLLAEFARLAVRRAFAEDERFKASKKDPARGKFVNPADEPTIKEMNARLVGLKKELGKRFRLNFFGAPDQGQPHIQWARVGELANKYWAQTQKWQFRPYYSAPGGNTFPDVDVEVPDHTVVKGRRYPYAPPLEMEPDHPKNWHHPYLGDRMEMDLERWLGLFYGIVLTLLPPRNVPNWVYYQRINQYRHPQDRTDRAT